MSDYSDDRRCAICGSPITNNNPDGIGYSCRKAYEKARWKVFFKKDIRRYKYYYLKNKPIVEEFIEELSKVKFRSKFWKGFYPSICEQWKEKKFVSQKQYEIIWERLFRQNVDMEILENEGKKLSREFFEKWFEEISAKEMEHVANLANKLRHEK